MPWDEDETLELMKCPVRVGDGTDGYKSSWPSVDGGTVECPDGWKRIGKERVCSYCGSVHPEDFLSFLEKVDGMDYWVEMSAHSSRLYIRKADGEGIDPAKFYIDHDDSPKMAVAVKSSLALSQAKEKDRVARMRG